MRFVGVEFISYMFLGGSSVINNTKRVVTENSNWLNNININIYVL